MDKIQKQILENQKCILTTLNQTLVSKDIELFLASCLEKTQDLLYPIKEDLEKPCCEMPKDANASEEGQE